MLLPRALLAPCLPTLALDHHRGHRTPMLAALAAEAAALAEAGVEALVVASAQWEVDGPFLVDDGSGHRTLTDYADLGVEVRYDCAGHPRLARALVAAGAAAGLRVATGRHGVDSGASVPLRFLAPARSQPVVPLSVSRQPAAACRAWGRTLRTTLAAWPERVAFIVGGGLSHNLHAWRLRREVPEAAAFDAELLDALGRGDWARVGAPGGRRGAQVAAHADLRHLELLRGFVGAAAADVLAYESGPGVGLALAAFPLAAAEPGAAG